MYVADFETSTPSWIEKDGKSRVWAYAICEIGNEKNCIFGNSLDRFMEWCENIKNTKIFFHNLKFDGSFILVWLFEHGFTHVTDKKDVKEKTFTTLISDKGLFYSIEVYFSKNKKGKQVNKVTFQDSLKLLNMSVAQIAKSFNLEVSKLELDYNTYREEGHLLTSHEIDYIKHDVVIVAKALDFLISQGMSKMTTASNALAEYKSIISEKNFNYWFPPPKYDKDVRYSYKGGFTYLNPKFAGVDVKEGIVFDVNSLYPSVMYYEKLPYGEPIYFEGEYQKDSTYDVYIQVFTCQFELKKDHVPSIQLKHNPFFKATEYVTSSNYKHVTMCLTNIDLELFFEQYEVYNIVYHKGWKFKSTRGLFKTYIDKWSNAKIQAKVEGNHGLYQLAKLMLNSLYGRFAISPELRSNIPRLEDGVIKFTRGELETRDPLYVPIASFITSYARRKTISSAQKVYDKFIYADTDSLHLALNHDEVEEFIKTSGLDVDDTRLGAWKLESYFKRARFLRAKCYIEDEIDYKTGEIALKITCSGMPRSCYHHVTFDNFRLGNSFPGKLSHKNVKGGVILSEIEFTLKP